MAANESEPFGLKSIVLTGSNLLLLVLICFVYSFSAFKLDLKQTLRWTESDVGMVFLCASIGQNVAVHLGVACDRYGALVSYALTGVLKGVGLLGMWWCYSSQVTSVPLYGFFLFLDAQGMSIGIIVAMKEVQRVAPSSLSGLMAAVSKFALGAGGVYSTSMYDSVLSPDVGQHFLINGVASIGGCVLCGALAVALAPAAGGKKGGGEAEPLMPLILSRDYAAVFLGMVVTWGCSMVWNSNMASFSNAAQLSNGKEIRFTYNTAKTVLSLVVGPLCDLGSPRLWYFVTVACTVASCMVMLASGGSQCLVAAGLAGSAFGSIATLMPIMTRELSFRSMGTLYALAKIGGMASSSAWNWVAASTSDAMTPKGQSVCIGEECYRTTWLVILGTSGPILIFLLHWVATAAPKTKTS